MENTSHYDLPRATARRLPLYYRCLRSLKQQGVICVKSMHLAEALQIEGATVRRDMAYFGYLGKRGYGYNVDAMIDFFAKLLSDDELTNCVLIGAGNLGSALMKYEFHQNNKIRIAQVFDTSPQLIGKKIEGFTVNGIEQLKEKIKKENITVAILAVPAEVAQEIADTLVKAGIKGILNFTPIRVATPKDVLVQTVDLTNELQTLIYFMKHRN